MRRSSTIALLLLATCLASGAAPERLAFPWQSPNPDGNIASPAIAIGFFMDAVGIGLFAGASAAAGMNIGVTVGLYSAGCVLVGGGSVLMNLGVDARHRKLEEMGYTITTTSRGLSRTLSWVTLGCEVGALGVTLAVGDTMAGTITSLVLGGIGAIVEIVNLYVPRRTWLNDINTSIDGKTPSIAPAAKAHAPSRYAPTIAPIFGAGYDAGSRRITPILGLSVGL